jgi:putative pyruvate formate lyase activating enzyme
MAQYRPCYQAHDYPPLDRPITPKEYEAALTLAQKHGLKRLDRCAY